MHSINGDVVSYVNISAVGQEDGGVYRCEARNEAGSVYHSEEIFVMGPPFIKPVGNVTVLSGASIAIRCPVTGYPIQRVSWLKGMFPFAIQSHLMHSSSSLSSSAASYLSSFFHDAQSPLFPVHCDSVSTCIA